MSELEPHPLLIYILIYDIHSSLVTEPGSGSSESESSSSESESSSSESESSSSESGCHNGNGGGSCCSSSNQCLAGEGDCDDNVDCKGNLLCGKDNCNPELGFGLEFDCCYDHKKNMYDNWKLLE